MKFLVLSHIFPPAIDGGSSHLFSIGNCLKNHGHQVFYLSSNCFSTDDFVTPKSKYLPTSKHQLPVYKNLRKILKLINPVLAKGPVFKILPFFKTLQTLKKFHPDYIISGPFPTAINLYAPILVKILQTKLISVPCFHSNEPLFSHPSLIKTLKASNQILCLTNFEKKYLSSHFHLKPNQVHIIPSGIPKTLLKTTPAIFPKIPHLLYIGSFSAHKGLEDLIKALPPHCQITLAGQKTLHWPKIQKLIKNQKNIHTIFNFHTNYLPKLLDTCTCLILPSTQESFGKVLLEAWARKKPVIVKNTPAPASLVKKSHGGLIFTNNLNRQILKLANNPKLCLRLGQNGYQFVKKDYTWDKIGDKLCQKLFS
ncbi:glycosyltransferase family 4 protein [Patescibacteria group bacterium]|nr:glycosyltransferase family 4 protein [Patescibacteria group bacterium]